MRANPSEALLLTIGCIVTCSQKFGQGRATHPANRPGWRSPWTLPCGEPTGVRGVAGGVVAVRHAGPGEALVEMTTLQKAKLHRKAAKIAKDLRGRKLVFPLRISADPLRSRRLRHRGKSTLPRTTQETSAI